MEGLATTLKRPVVVSNTPRATVGRVGTLFSDRDTPCSSSQVRTPFAKKGSSTNVKIVQAQACKTPGGKLQFTKIGQTFIDVTEHTATVEHITSVIQRKWGEDYVLVTADGLRLEDSSGTKGFVYTVCIFAIRLHALLC